ncbi:MAG: cyclic nucleotide-binding domain-containing protein [Gammaproteobacteria bacterium]|nr:cyclic nucleotide-binding domain-containing protein [Gammaproteobacteria bacterium]
MSDSLWGNLFSRNKTWDKQVAALWAQTPLFNDIPYNEIARLVRDMVPRDYSEGETIFSRGEEGAGAALIVEGEVEIRAGDVTLTRLNTGDFFGEVALVLDVPRTADAVASADTRLLFFLQAGLEEWLNRRPYYAGRLSKNLANILAQRLITANAALADKAGS